MSAMDEARRNGDLSDLEWLVWFARKSKGRAEDVARRAWEQNPTLRFDDREREAVEAERKRLKEAIEGKRQTSERNDDQQQAAYNAGIDAALALLEPR